MPRYNVGMRYLLGTLALASWAASVMATPSFTPLVIPNGGTGWVFSLSRDGSSVGVQGTYKSLYVYVYNRTGWHPLPLKLDNWYLTGAAISGDGDQLVGGVISQPSAIFYWNNGAYGDFIGPAQNGQGLSAISANGELAVGLAGVYDSNTSQWEQYAIRYEVGADDYSWLPHPSGWVDSTDQADSCSEDGQVIVGSSAKLPELGMFPIPVPVEWNNGAPRFLPLVSGQDTGSAMAVNDFGNIVVEYQNVFAATPDAHIVLYENGLTKDLGTTPLGNLVGSVSLSNDGNVILMSGSASVYPNIELIWTPLEGFVDAVQFLKNHGVPFGDYTNISVYSVSADGTTFAGTCNPSDGNQLVDIPFIAKIDPLFATPTAFTLASSIVGGNNAAAGITFSSESSKPFNVVVSGTNRLVSGVESIPAGRTSYSFLVPTSGVSTSTEVVATATLGATSLSKTITLLPASMSSVTLNGASIAGGDIGIGVIHLNGNSPVNGATAELSSSDAAVAAVASTVNLAGNASILDFAIDTKPVSAAKAVTISVTYAGVKKTLPVTVEPASLGSVEASPSSVVGGKSSTITVTLEGLAYTGGAKISLKSSDTALATVPASVTIAAGMGAIKATVATKAVTKPTTVTITATYGTVSRTCTVTLTP